MSDIHAVTGAFGFSGSYIAARLLNKGKDVITLTDSPERQSPLQGKLKAYPFNFHSPLKLAEALRGVRVLYNTYWVRFNHREFRYSEAVKNSLILFEAARNAGVERIVHISITNASRDSHLEYFRGKAVLEEALVSTGVSHSILRPAILFGNKGILLNNIAWFLRRFPFFGVLGDGLYRLQPIHVDDLAKLAVQEGKRIGSNTLIEAIGPETFTFTELVRTLAQTIGEKRPILRIPHELGYALTRLTGLFVHDVILTHDEVEGLMEDLLYVDAPPAGNIKLSDWVNEHASTLGLSYMSELKRRLDRHSAY